MIRSAFGGLCLGQNVGLDTEIVRKKGYLIHAGIFCAGAPAGDGGGVQAQILHQIRLLFMLLMHMISKVLYKYLPVVFCHVASPSFAVWDRPALRAGYRLRLRRRNDPCVSVCKSIAYLR